MRLCDNCLEVNGVNNFQVGPSGYSDQRENVSTKTQYVDLCLACRTALYKGDFDALAKKNKKVVVDENREWGGPVR